MKRLDIEEDSRFPGFYKPLSEKYRKFIVSKYGIIRNTHDGIVREKCLGTWGYWTVDRYLLHLIIADTFIYKQQDDLVVNHRDGNKLNCSIDNLEWVTRSRNSLHAYQTGLRNDNICISCINLISNEEHDFYSISSCANFIGINPGKVTTALQKDAIRWSPNGVYYFRYYEDDWPEKLPHYTNVYVGHVGPIFLAITKQNKLLFKELKQLCEYFNFRSNTIIMRMLRSKNKDIIEEDVRIIRSDNTSFPLLSIDAIMQSETKRKFDNRGNKPPQPIEVHFIDSGIKRTYSSTQLFANEIGEKKNTVQKGILIGNGRWRNYNISYINRPVMQ